MSILTWLSLCLPAFAQDTGEFLDEDADRDGFTVGEGDCDDHRAAVHPGVKEVCFDELDNDCDGLADAFCDDEIRLGSLGGGGGCPGGRCGR